MEEGYTPGAETLDNSMSQGGDDRQTFDAARIDYTENGDESEPRTNTSPSRLTDCVLFVGNIPFQTPWQHVKDLFRKAGKVRYTDLVADRLGRPKGSALVTMMTPEGAKRAMEMFNESAFEGRRLIVRRFENGPRPPLVHRSKMPLYNRTVGFRTGLYGAAPFRSPFPAAGAPGLYRTMGSPIMGRPGPGMAPVMAPGSFRNGPYMGNDMVGGPMLGDDADVDLPKPRSQQVSETGRRIFVSNLPFDCTSAALRETFQQVGTVVRAEVIFGRTGKSRGMGIVVMKNAEEARVAIAEFDGIEMANRAMSVRLDNKNSML